MPYQAIVTQEGPQLLLGGVTAHRFTPCQCEECAHRLGQQCVETNRGAGREALYDVKVVQHAYPLPCCCPGQ